MKKTTFIVFTILTIGIIAPFIAEVNKNPDRKPWADQWTQEFLTHADGSDTLSGGLVYYSWKQKSYKVQYQRAVFSPCSFFVGILSGCNFLILDQKFYIQLPAKKQCGLLDDQFQFPPPYWTSVDSVYINTTIINETSYYLWTSKSDKSYNLYTSIDQRQINVWDFQLTSNYHLNEYFYVNDSYYPAIEQDVFDLPEWCKTPTLQLNLNEEKKTLLEKMFRFRTFFNLKSE